MATVGEVMTRSILVVDPSATVGEAATIMGERPAGSVLVMDGERLLGIFTERDIVKVLGQHSDAAVHPVSEWMTSEPMTIRADTPTAEALRTMVERGFRHLPVIEGDAVVGVVSMRDLSASPPS